jgi:hypothetical protein
MINVGESEAQKDCLNAQNTLTALLDREQKNEYSLQAAIETQKMQQQKMAEVSKRLKELEAKAKEAGINDQSTIDQISTGSQKGDAKGN